MELIVLQALVLAHERLDLYGHLLNSVRSVIFFGVPHRGSDVAFWAAFAASLLQHALLGFPSERAMPDRKQPLQIMVQGLLEPI